MAKHHPGLNFSKLDMEAVEKEILDDRQSAEGVGEGGEVAAVDPSSSAFPCNFFFRKTKTTFLWARCFECIFFLNNLLGSYVLSKQFN